MLYEKPKMEIIKFLTEDVVRTSGEQFQDGSNPGIEGDGYSDLNNGIW